MTGLEGLLAGRVLGGRYLVEEVIGRGGMGAVYRALDERLGRRVALKVITLAGAGDPESRERLRARFHREARAAAALPHHPNVVPVYDYGTDETLGLDYIVMELLRGSDLATRLARAGTPSLAAALRILLQTARGLTVGHRAGLIHRDVKPGNIFLAESDHQEIQVRVVDFGIAKLVDEEDTANHLTQEGRAPHSPAFASPEQLRGLSRLTPASDVFSLGAVGFLLLTGERPFSETDRNRMSLGMPVEAPALRARNPAIPSSVEAVIQRSLAFHPEDRYADAGVLMTALEQAVRELSGSPVEPYPGEYIPSGPDDDDHTQLFEEEDRTEFIDPDDRTLLAPPPQTAPPPPPRREPPARALPPRPALEEPRRSRRGVVVWSLVLLALAAVGVWAVMEAGGPQRTAEVIPDAPDSLPIETPEILADSAAEPTELDAYMYAREGVRYFGLGQYDSAYALFERAVQVSPENAEYRRNLGYTLLRLGNAEQAAEQLRQALALDPGRDIIFANLGEAQLALGDTAAAIASYQRFMERSTDPVQRGRVERLLRSLQAAREAPVDTTGGADDTLPTQPRDTVQFAPSGVE